MIEEVANYIDNMDALSIILLVTGIIAFAIGLVVVLSMDLGGDYSPIIPLTFMMVGVVMMFSGLMWGDNSKEINDKLAVEEETENIGEKELSIIEQFEKEVGKSSDILTVESDTVYVEDEDGQKWELVYKADFLVEYNKIPKTN